MDKFAMKSWWGFIIPVFPEACGWQDPFPICWELRVRSISKCWGFCPALEFTISVAGTEEGGQGEDVSQSCWWEPCPAEQ